MRFNLSPTWTPRRLFWITPALALVAAGFYGLAFGRIVLNGTSSMPENAYLMVTWPKHLSRGMVVAAQLPTALKQSLGQQNLYLTKRIVGLPGDPVTHEGSRICIHETCVRAQNRDGRPISPLWQADTVPAGTVAVFGESLDSLDSRYDVIGAIPFDTIIATGFPIPFPHWKTLREMLQ